ncbi:MAG: polyprenyl synthetase family protein [Bacteroidales bacterium]|jgi:octaprenyl-diphosphate synthase|nr:polyprenyl synthetase family protein [Bacteroidales bacterium]
MKFKDIILPIEPAFQKFKHEFSNAMTSEIPLLNDVFNHIQTSQGKQIRPVLILLSAEICGEITPKTYRSAVLTEVLHLATLLHDDVIDQAEIRRNQLSVNAKWNNKVAILVGDYLFAKTLKIATAHSDYELLELMNEAIKKVSEGELIQMQNTANVGISEDIYNDIISKKTASLFAAACACGAFSANTNKENVLTFHQIGWHLGMAFQIKDDLLDLLPNTETGKMKDNDIHEQKFTLPLIHFLKTASEINKKSALDIIQNHYLNSEKVQHLSQQILDSESLIYTQSKIAEHIEKATNLLNPFSDSVGKTTLQNLMNFIANRNH